MRRLISLLFVLSLAAACEPSSQPPATASSESPATLASEEDKIIYAVGVTLARSVAMLDLDEREVEIVKRGMEDRLFGQPLAVDIAEYGPKMAGLAHARTALAAKKEREASKSFLAEAAAAPGAITTESGLIYTQIEEGTGPKPGPADEVEVHYHGTLRDGTVFDSSRDRGKPAIFTLNRVIPCWTEALQMIKVGGRASIVCPADIAYGDRGAGEIKPGAALRFDVELISIK